MTSPAAKMRGHGCGHCAGIGSHGPAVPTLHELLPHVLPAGWSAEAVELPPYGVPAAKYCIRAPRRADDLVVFVTLDDGAELGDESIGLWLHSSTSRVGAVRDHLPRWEDLKLVHQVVHQDRPVVQVLPPKSSWLSIADCLHLFERLDAPTIPEGLWRK